MNAPTYTLPPLPAQPADTPWPTMEWPTAPLGADVDKAKLDALLERAFVGPSLVDMGETHATLIVQNGAIVAERYAEGMGPEDTFPSWSMAKSITQALTGILVGEGRLDIQGQADVPEWSELGDPRGEITLDQLLRMSSGLKFAEDYLDDQESDVIPMLFGEGQHDVAAFAANFPLQYEPNTFWSYSSGTTNIIAAILKRATGLEGERFKAWMFEALFDRIGITSAIPKFDTAGTFIGSSFCFCTARDFARFGLLYLRGGTWDGDEVVSRQWVDYARTPTPQPLGEPLGYGAHWWLGLGGPGSFSANGYQGQFTVCVPELDLVLVRHGDSLDDKVEEVKRWIPEVIGCFR